MFLIDKVPTCAWSHTSFGRGKRPVPTTLGFYVIEHIATGKLLVGYSRKVSEDIDKQIEALLAGKHPIKAMNIQVAMDRDLKLHEYPALSIAQAKDGVRTIRKSIYPEYLLLN